MFRLSTKELPADSTEFARALHDGLVADLAAGGRAVRVTAEGPSARELDLLEIGLDGATLDPANRPVPGPDREPGIVAERFSLAGRPMRLNRQPFEVAIEARGVRFAVARNGEGRAILLPEAAREGTGEIFVSEASLNAWIAEGLRRTAERHRLEVVDVEVALTDAPEGVQLHLLVAVRKLFTARLRIEGRIVTAPGPVLRVEDVTCRGEGLSGAAVAKLVRHQVESLSGRQFALNALLPGFAGAEVTLRADRGLRLKAVLREKHPPGALRP